MKWPTQIAAGAVFLASDQGRSINGETIAIDDGALTDEDPALLAAFEKAS
jgi:enoyl-[acyl-carrier-protein] reductase (NADH)